MSVGAHRQMSGIFHQQSSCEIDGGHHALRKHRDGGFGFPEEVVVGEEASGCRVIERAGHHVPGDFDSVLSFGRHDLFGEDLEQRLAGDRGAKRGGAEK